MSKKIKKNNLDQFAPSHKKNLDNLKLLLSDLDIKQIVARTRKFLNIPTGGFADPENIKTEEELGQWRGEMYKREKELLDRFRPIVKKIKEQVKAKLSDEATAQKQIDMLYEQLPENYLTARVVEIIKNCNLPINYEDSIRRYLVFGNIFAPAHPFNVVSYSEDPKVRLRESVTVKFYSKLTDDDLKPLKKLVNNIFGEELPESPGPIKDIDKKIKIEEINRNREVFDVRDRVGYKLTAREIAEMVDDESEPYTATTINQVHDAPRELKKLRDKRFKKVLGK